MKGIERDTDGQCNIEQDWIWLQAKRFKTISKLYSEEIVVLEYTEYAEVIDDAQPKKEISFFFTGWSYPKTIEIIKKCN